MKKKIIVTCLLFVSFFLIQLEAQTTYTSWKMETATCEGGGTYQRCWNECTVTNYPNDPTGCICIVSQQTTCNGGGGNQQ